MRGLSKTSGLLALLGLWVLLPARGEAYSSGGFTTSASPATVSVEPSKTVTLAASVKNDATTSTTVLVDLEVYSAGGTKVAQRFWDSQAFSRGATRSYSLSWAVPANQEVGRYTLKIGVFSPNWGSQKHWNATAATITVTRPPTAPTVAYVYRDALASGWSNWSWDTGVNFSAVGQVYAGSNAINFTTRAGAAGFYLHAASPFTTSAYKTFRFAARATSSGQAFSVTMVNSSGTALGPRAFLSSYGGMPSSSAWKIYEIPLSAMGVTSSVGGFWFQDETGAAQPGFYLDEISFTSAVTSPPDAGSGGGGGDAGSGGGGGGATDAGSGGGGGGTGTPAGWLSTSGNKIRTADGAVWKARGVNIHDTRSCNACTYSSPNVAEVKRRIDLAVAWGANFLRLDLESYASSEGRVQWQNVLGDAGYLADVKEIVRYIGTKPGVRVMVSLWEDPTFTSQGWPSSATGDVWAKLAQTFVADSHVLFGVVNEPQNNYDGAQDATVWNAMNQVVARIRAVEDAAGKPYHIVAVQGTGGWARRLDYYVTHPITAGGGRNVAYEIHVYDAAQYFDNMFVRPAQTIPVIIGEFGPTSNSMTIADSQTLMSRAQQLQIPWLAWTFHMRCPPNLLAENSGGGCGVGMPLQVTSWGTAVKNQLAQPY